MYVIRKGSHEEQAPGTWWGQKMVMVKCPDCEGVVRISRASGGHHIFSSGEVQPSLDCPNDECEFHEFVTLEGWGGQNETS